MLILWYGHTFGYCLGMSEPVVHNNSSAPFTLLGRQQSIYPSWRQSLYSVVVTQPAVTRSWNISFLVVFDEGSVWVFCLHNYVVIMWVLRFLSYRAIHFHIINTLCGRLLGSSLGFFGLWDIRINCFGKIKKTFNSSALF